MDNKFKRPVELFWRWLQSWGSLISLQHFKRWGFSSVICDIIASASILLNWIRVKVKAPTKILMSQIQTFGNKPNVYQVYDTWMVSEKNFKKYKVTVVCYSQMGCPSVWGKHTPSPQGFVQRWPGSSHSMMMNVPPCPSLKRWEHAQTEILSGGTKAMSVLCVDFHCSYLTVQISNKQLTLEAAGYPGSHLRAALCPTARMKSEHFNLFPDFRHSDTSGFQCSCTTLMWKAKSYDCRAGI